MTITVGKLTTKPTSKLIKKTKKETAKYNKPLESVHTIKAGNTPI